jgi:hypothetical protein
VPNNKNQHYVPRCHLKPFTVDGQGRCINLFNLPRSAPIADAPVKNQCSGDYFYGADEKLESAINSVENGYAGLLPDMLNVNARVDARLRIVLQRFIYLQHLRTELSSRNAAKMLLAMYDIPGQTEPTPNLKDAARQAVHSSMLAYSDTHSIMISSPVNCICSAFSITRLCLPVINTDKIQRFESKRHFHYLTSCRKCDHPSRFI